jgi:hypothetical protein
MSRTPGPTLPGLRTPGRRTPGRDTPGTGLDAVDTLSATGVAVDATGTTAIGTTDEIEGQVIEATINGTAADFEFQILIDDTTIFDSPQSPPGTSPYTFSVDGAEDAAFFRGDSGVTVYIEVTSASATGGATADVSTTHTSRDQR